MSPTHRSGTTDCHLVLDGSVCKYFFLQLSQKNIFQEINTPQLFVFKSLASQQDRLLPYFNNNSIYSLIQRSSSRSKESQKSSIEHKTLLFMLSSYEHFFSGYLSKWQNHFFGVWSIWAHDTESNWRWKNDHWFTDSRTLDICVYKSLK